MMAAPVGVKPATPANANSKPKAAEQPAANPAPKAAPAAAKATAKSPAAKVNLGATMIGAGVAPPIVARSKPAGGASASASAGKEQAAAARQVAMQPLLEQAQPALGMPAVSQIPVRPVAEPAIAVLDQPAPRSRSDRPPHTDPRVIDVPASPSPEPPLKLHTQVAGHAANAAANTVLDYTSSAAQPSPQAHVANVVDPLEAHNGDHRYLPGDPMAPQPTAANRGSARLRLPNDELPATVPKNERVWLYWAVCGVVVFSVMLLAFGLRLF
jgi:hypothetical protein